VGGVQAVAMAFFPGHRVHSLTKHTSKPGIVIHLIINGKLQK
jgi:hypothetical protein